MIDLQDKQKCFEYAVKALFQQGERCEEDGRCIYLADNGNRCIFGHLLPEDFMIRYRGSIKYLGADRVIDKYWSKLGFEEKPDTFVSAFYSSMQSYLHDFLIEDDAPFRSQLKEKAQKFADKYNLLMPELNEP